MELTGEERLTSQRFDVVIIWGSEESHVSAERLQEILWERVGEIDPDATIDVDEIEEPAH